MQPSIKNDLLYLLRMLECCGKINIYAGSFSNAESFYTYKDQIAFNACLSQLTQLGEQAKKLSDELTEVHSHIEWHQIKGFRNRVVHEYARVNMELVFETVSKSLPLLSNQLVPVIKAEIANGNFDIIELNIAKTSPYLLHVDFSLFDQ